MLLFSQKLCIQTFAIDPTVTVMRDVRIQCFLKQSLEKKGKLMFLNKNGTHFEFDDLLKASGDGLGNGNFGKCYKTMLDIEPAVVVKSQF